MAEKCDVLEYYRSKRLFSFIIALICFTVVVVFVEEYAEDDSGDDSQIKSISKTPSNDKSSSTARPEPSEMCWLSEKVSVIDSCVRCTDFERHAIKAKHCTPTGFYDRLNCTESGRVVLRPCRHPPSSIQATFYCFLVINVVLMLVSYFVSVKRMTELNRLAYARVTQNLDY
ncbi:hypothetical protein KIN20_023539 [Parelaphostrongylus tenuis]|uniref:Jumping translocation breakpoint protein n=1 Tax=Parelaphostrongylus tenuis TaxID=148309 RepID=A0AAD5QW62_PARTN|nr:hypothetical protein KIN20_023539 [Parelaphostrongylus tenuis]